MPVNWPRCTFQDRERLYFSIMVRDSHWHRFMEEFRVQAEQEVQIDARRSGRFDFWRQVVEGMEVVENNVQLTFWDFLPLVLVHKIKLLWERSGLRTYYDKEVCITGLHSGGRGRVLVPHEVFSINDGDYRVHFEITSLTFQLSQLERECRWECRAGTLDDNSIWSKGI